MEEHDIVDRDIDDLSVLGDGSFIGDNVCLFNMVILVPDKCIQSTVDSVIFARFDLNGDSGKTVIIVDQVIYLTLVAVIVVEQSMSVCDQFAGYNGFVNRAEIDAALIVQHGTDITAV